MSIREFFRRRRQKRAARRAIKRGQTTEFKPLEDDPSDITPPPSRYTDEYRDFIESLRSDRSQDEAPCDHVKAEEPDGSDESLT